MTGRILVADNDAEMVSLLGHHLEDRYIRRVLEEAKGDKTAAARILGISVRTLQRRKL